MVVPDLNSRWQGCKASRSYAEVQVTWKPMTQTIWTRAGGNWSGKTTTMRKRLTHLLFTTRKALRIWIIRLHSSRIWQKASKTATSTPREAPIKPIITQISEMLKTRLYVNRLSALFCANGRRVPTSSTCQMAASHLTVTKILSSSIIVRKKTTTM